MPAGDIEVMHHVAQVVPIELHAGLGLHHQLEREATLRAIGPGLHARFHQALAHVLAIAKFRQMANGIVHKAFQRILNGTFEYTGYSDRKHSSGGLVREMSPSSLNCPMSVSQRSRDMLPSPLCRVSSVSMNGFCTWATSANVSGSMVGFSWFICWLIALGSSR